MVGPTVPCMLADCRLLNDHVFHVCLHLLLWCIVVWWVRSVLVTHHSAFAVTSCMLCTTCSLYIYIYIYQFCSFGRDGSAVRAVLQPGSILPARARARLGPSRPFSALLGPSWLPSTADDLALIFAPGRRLLRWVIAFGG